MKTQVHIVASLVVSSAVYIFFNSLCAAIISFLAGVFIDVDHYFDYFLRYRKLNVKHFFNVYAYPPLLDRYYLLLHSFELIIIFWIAIHKFELGLLWIAVAFGLTQHIVLDYLSNTKYTRLYFYFITARFLAGFRKEYLFK